MKPSAAPWWWLAAVSVAVHLLTARLPVSVATTSGIPGRPTYGDVVFLGAIMTAPGEATHAPRDAGRGPVEPEPLPREPLAGLEAQATAPIPPLAPHLFHLEKPIPHAVTTVLVTPRRATAPIWIRGPARLRELRHRPPLASYLQRVPITRLRSHDTPATVALELRFTLAPDGHVQHVEVMHSSGDPLLDLVGAQYLADWRFAPLDVKVSRTGREPWGQVTLRLDLGPVTE